MAGHILIVDDDAALCDMLCGALRRRGFSATSCNSAPDALRELSERPPDVVVTDINMADMSGLDLCRRLAETRADVPVVVITAFGSMETAIEAIRAGAWDYVTK